MSDDGKVPFRTANLAGGLLLEFFDCSNRYFGDYHRVRVEVLVRVPLDNAAFAHAADPAAELQKARALLGDEVRFTRILEKMGVPSASVTDEKEMLITSFLESSASYMEKTSFRARFIAKELALVRQGRRPRLVRNRP
jgi:hypothetical protein